LAGDTEAVHVAEPPLKFTGIVEGATVPDESATPRLTMIPGEGEENATGDGGADCRVETAEPVTTARNCPLSAMPVSCTVSVEDTVVGRLLKHRLPCN
jgi:hypothetical protein